MPELDEDVIVRCKCGRSYDQITWSELAFGGLMNLPDEGSIIEHRHCECRSTITREHHVPALLLEARQALQRRLTEDLEQYMKIEAGFERLGELQRAGRMDEAGALVVELCDDEYGLTLDCDISGRLAEAFDPDGKFYDAKNGDDHAGTTSR